MQSYRDMRGYEYMRGYAYMLGIGVYGLDVQICMIDEGMNMPIHVLGIGVLLHLIMHYTHRYI